MPSSSHLERPPVAKNAVLAVIEDAFLRARRDRLPKIAQLYAAIVDAIATGKLAGGAKLPGERDLSDALGISLGTTQKSLALLSRDGQIVREHGRGSFVQSHRKPLHELWHYRFRDRATGDLLPIYAKLIDRRITRENGRWSEALGPDGAGYVEIVRRIDVAGEFSCWSAMRLRATPFARLLKLPVSAIQNVNLKGLLHREFDAPTIGVRQSVRSGVLSKGVADLIGGRARQSCLVLEVTALSRWNAPLSHQTIIVPATSYEMELGAEPSIAEAVRPGDAALRGV